MQRVCHHAVRKYFLPNQCNLSTHSFTQLNRLPISTVNMAVFYWLERSVKPGPNNASCSAFWPGSGNSLQAIDTERMRVGDFIKHSIKFKACIGSNLHETEHHLFAYVEWKKIHQHYNCLGNYLFGRSRCMLLSSCTT